MRIAMTKGSITLIRTNLAGMKEAQERGFVVVGNCDEAGVVIPGPVVIDPEPTKNDGLEKLTVDELKAKLEELKIEIPGGAKKADLVALLQASEQK